MHQPSSQSNYLTHLINEGHRPRNQIATLSGLTNTYIRNLERGEIVNVPRERLIAVAVALNLDLNEVERLLASFDRARLSVDDIPHFIATAGRCAISEAVLAVRDLFSYELIMLSVEKDPGPQFIISDRPTISLLARGHRSYTVRNLLPGHPVYSDLIEAIGDARKQNFFRLVKHHRVEHCICRQCLGDYLSRCPDAEEKAHRLRHVAALLRVVQTEPNFFLYLTDACVNFNFTLKSWTDAGAGPDRLAYSARAPHDIYREKQGRIFGFVTENPTLAQTFRAELQRLKASAEEHLMDRKQQETMLTALLRDAIRDIDPETKQRLRQEFGW